MINPRDKVDSCYLGVGICILEGPRNRMKNMHLHHELEISIVKSGSGHYAINDKIYEMKAGDIFIINNKEPHSIYLNENENMVNIVVHFSPRFIWSNNTLDIKYLGIFFNRNKNFSNKIDSNNPNVKEIQNLFWDLFDEYKGQKKEYMLFSKVKLLNILALFLRNFDFTNTIESNTLQSQQVHIVDQITEYLDAHFTDKIQMKELGDIAHIHPSYLSTIFKRFHGLTPKEYIIRKRLANSKYYLSQTNLSVLDISFECGFNSITNFHRAFKKITGLTPSAYRKNTLNCV